MSDELLVDKRQVRRSFERAAATYDSAAVLQNEVCQRVLGRLDYIRCRPATILDAGSGTGNALAGLAQRYPQARLVALDIAPAMLLRARARVPWWKQMLARQPRPAALCADLERLPVADASVGMVWSNLALQWVNDPQQAFAEMQRVLAPGGLLMFSTFGPDTLKELRIAYQGTDRHTHVNRFTDMHDIGDMLLHSGFADPVVDMEIITVTYADVRELMRDLKAIGAHNVTRGRPAALSGRSRFDAMARNYETFRREGKLPATFEVIYGHAWKPESPRLPAGLKPVKVHRPPRKGTGSVEF